jgi:nicotinate phosphoribosyltransferase
MENQIITSILDADRYKFTMSYFAWKKHPSVYVMYTFKNRTKDIRLADYIDIGDLRAQIYALSRLKLTEKEISYLDSWKIFPVMFMDFLRKTIGKTPINFGVEKTIDGQFDIYFEGLWPHVILYETMILSIINEMFAKNIMIGMNKKAIDLMYREGKVKTQDKLEMVSDCQAQYVEFGTRRRHSVEWQEKVLEACINTNNPNFLGTSNCKLAMKYNIPCLGTIAHEVFMVRAALDHATYNLEEGSIDKDWFRDTQKRSIQDWIDVYGKGLSVILTDTFGTDDFFRVFDKKFADFCLGVRQDSGDPFVFGEKTIEHYNSLGINPCDKKLMFSDGLDVDMICNLQKTFKGRIIPSYGWGTNLTNDLWIKPLSIVVKATYANDVATVKLSDNMAKAMGPDKMVEFYKNVFAYDKTNFTQTTY